MKKLVASIAVAAVSVAASSVLVQQFDKAAPQPAVEPKDVAAAKPVAKPELVGNGVAEPAAKGVPGPGAGVDTAQAKRSPEISVADANYPVALLYDNIAGAPRLVEAVGDGFVLADAVAGENTVAVYDFREDAVRADIFPGWCFPVARMERSDGSSAFVVGGGLVPADAPDDVVQVSEALVKPTRAIARLAQDPVPGGVTLTLRMVCAEGHWGGQLPIQSPHLLDALSGQPLFAPVEQTG